MQPRARGERLAPDNNLRAAHRVSCCLRSLFLHDKRGLTTACCSAPSTGARTVRKGHRQRMMRELLVAQRTHHESRHCAATVFASTGVLQLPASEVPARRLLVLQPITRPWFMQCQHFGGRCHGRLCQLAYECSWPSICRSAQSPSSQHLWICAAST